MKDNEVVVDSRGKVSLRFRKHLYDRYRAEEAEDGTITLTPLAVVPARLVSAMKSPMKEFAGKIPSIGEVQEKVREIPLWGDL